MSTGTVTATSWDGDGTWLVSLHGDHDLATRAELERQTRAIWQACKVAVIDLSEVAFIDSGVIRWLLNVERELEAAGAFTFSIVEGSAGSVAERLFGLLRMRYVLACYPTREAALAQAPARVNSAAQPPPGS
jgi:anti-anti-sigma regulatory factor